MAAELSLPEAQRNLTAAAERFIAEAEHIIALRQRELAEEAYQEGVATYIRASGAYIRACDWLLDAVERYEEPLSPEYAAQVPVVRAGRMAAFMELRELAPVEAEYWSVENQARIRRTDRGLTPEKRSKAMSEVAEAYAALRADPVASAAFDEECAALSGTLMDGLEDDPYPL